MVRILHTSDWHVGRAIRGRSRADEHREVLGEIAGIADDRRADLVLVSGDLFDVAAPTPESEQIVYQALLRLAETAPVVIVAGNHDNPRRLRAVAPLLELGRVRVGSFLARPDEGGSLLIEELGVRVALFPWQSQRGIVTAADLIAKDAFEHAQGYADRMASVIDALCSVMSVDTVNLAVGHLMVHGAETSGSERAVHTVFDYSVPALAFPGHLAYVALGHLHRQQRVPAPAPMWYAGSPLQLDFGESGHPKGVVVVEAEPGLPARIDPVGLSGGRRLVRLRGTLEQVEAAVDEVGDAHVRVELEEPASVGLADRVRSIVPGVVDVVLAATPGAAPASEPPPARLGRDPRHLFAEYLAARRVDDERLLELFDELLEEAHEA